MSRIAAGRLLDKLNDRRKQGLATYKQVRLLARYGITDEVHFEGASSAITYLAECGWGRKQTINPKKLRRLIAGP